MKDRGRRRAGGQNAGDKSLWKKNGQEGNEEHGKKRNKGYDGRFAL